MSIQYSFRQVASTAAIAWCGALTEWVDFYTYAILAMIIARVFFPSEDPIASLLASFAALAIGFLFRPLGALLFGKIGDQFGRKTAFLLAIVSMLAGTMGIGLLPTYAQIGVAASIAVFLLRIVQGLALGGGFGAAIVYLGESVPEHRRGMITGFLFTTAPGGMAFAAIIVAAMETLLGKEALVEWAWRIPFIIAGLIVVAAALIFHLFYKETPIFSMLKTVRRVTSAPIRELFSKREYLFYVLLGWIGVVGAHGPIWYTNQLVVKYYMDWHGVSPGLSSWILSIATFMALWAYILFGWLSDKIGRRPILLTGIYLNALAFIAVFHLIPSYCNPPNIPALLALTAVLTLMNGIGYSGAMSAFLLELFPARIRVTGVALAYNLGYGVTGGLTPLMITWLYTILHSWFLAVIAWSTVVPMAMASLYVVKGCETLGTRIWAELSAGKFVKKPLILPPTMPIKEAAHQLLLNGYRSAIVKAKRIGIIEERAILKAIASGLSAQTPISKIATYTGCIRSDDPLPKVFAAMEKYNVRSIPICSSKGEIIGLIEARELLAEALALKTLAKKKITLKFKLADIGKIPITINHTATVREAIKIMAENNIGLLPVTENNKLIAVFSERDALKALATTENLDTPHINYATKNPITLNPNTTVREAIEAMLKHNFRHIIAVENNTPKYIASVKDILEIIG